MATRRGGPMSLSQGNCESMREAVDAPHSQSVAWLHRQSGLCTVVGVAERLQYQSRRVRCGCLAMAACCGLRDRPPKQCASHVWVPEPQYLGLDGPCPPCVLYCKRQYVCGVLGTSRMPGFDCGGPWHPLPVAWGADFVPFRRAACWLDVRFASSCCRPGVHAYCAGVSAGTAE
jgi:hypothetical protein